MKIEEKIEKYLNEAPRKQDESFGSDLSGREIIRNKQKEFVQGIGRKSTTFYYNQGETDNAFKFDSNISKFFTEDEEGNRLELKIERRSEQHIKSSGTRDPEKTRSFIKVSLRFGKDGKIDLFKKSTIGEDANKMKKFEKQKEKIKETLENTFGIKVKILT